MPQTHRMTAVEPLHARVEAATPVPEITDDALEYALRTSAIVPYFQPIVDVQSGNLRGFEVLARWRTSDGRLLLPDAFIPVAVNAGLIASLTIHLVEQACRAAREWPGDFYLAFNMPPTMLQESATVDHIIATLKATGFPLRRIRVEMTEVEVVEDERAAELGIAHLRELGIKTMLDDFGTGYSSLVRLHRFQFDKIKIDGSFIRALEQDEASRKIVSAIVGLGKSLGAKVVAESVETRFQLEFLASIGCDTYQGWWLAPAMDAATAAGWLARFEPRQAAPSSTHLTPYQRQYQLEILYERSPVGLAFIDPDLRFAAANTKFCNMIHVPRYEVIGQKVTDVLPVEIGGRALELILRGFCDDQGDLSEVVMPHTAETFLLNHERVSDAGGVVLGVSVVCIDVTDTKRYEAALRAREQEDVYATPATPTVFWVAEESGELSYMTPHPMELAAMSVRERIDSWYARMDPPDRERVRSEWVGRDPAATMFQTRFRLEWPDGSRRWVLSRGDLKETGHARRWYGFFTDITREVELEERLGSAVV